MSNKVRVLASDSVATTNNQASEQEDNFLIEDKDDLAFTPENFKNLINENVKYRMKVHALQEEMRIMYDKYILKLPPKMEITYKAL